MSQPHFSSLSQMGPILHFTLNPRDHFTAECRDLRLFFDWYTELHHVGIMCFIQPVPIKDIWTVSGLLLL